jgi:hypothetical protein
MGQAPGLLAGGLRYAFSARDRKWPVELFAQVQQDRVTLQAPPGYAWDEVPGPVRLESAYGTFTAHWKAQADSLVSERSLEVRDATVPPGEYAQLRQFFDRAAGAQQASVVMLRK